MITTLHSSNLPTLPKGLPALTAKPSTFVIYFAANQLRKVKSRLTDPDDALIVGGVPVFDERLPQAPAAMNAGTAAIWRTMDTACAGASGLP